MRKVMAGLLALCSVSSVLAQGTGQQTATTTLSVGQLQALRESPVILVPAPGPGMAINPVSATLQYNFGTQHYAGGHGRFVLSLGPYGGANPLDVFDDVLTTGFTDQDSDQTVAVQGYPSKSATSAENLDLEIVNFGPPLIDGDGTVTVTVSYNIISTQ